MPFIYHEDATRALAAWAVDVQREAASPFEAAQQIVRRLGIHLNASGQAEIGFWTPELSEQDIAPDAVTLECFTVLDSIDFSAVQQSIRFQRERVPLLLQGDYTWGVIEGMTAGQRDQIGTFYRLSYRNRSGAWRFVNDPLAYSIPFGAFAPAEFYDIAHMQAQRADATHFYERLDATPDDSGIPVVGAPVNILQIHVGTASEERTFAGLTKIYQTISDKIRAGEGLTPAEQNYIGYDAVQLMPVEPIIEYEAGPAFWQSQDTDPDAETLTVRLLLPDMTNWGYDVLVAASNAPNPVLLGSKRPDELVDLIATLHNFPGKPIKVLFDVVYGHTDNQALPLMNRHYFAGSNMYGQNLNYLNPVVRATLLEMQRRKHDFGLDGVRVDGAQDFKNWDPVKAEMWHDDAYLQQMSDVTQEVAGVRYRPWMIFEDGRPWPRDDWELTSTYREVTRQQPDIFQWGPLTFAHNTPFLFTFWISKWWRIKEITQFGGRWITGCANHDTLRRGTQVNTEARINTYLGDTLPEIFRNAYDNAAAKLFDYAMMPGLPMDFINASMRAPWCFIRNTDDRWGVKVMSEEARFIDWAVGPTRFERDATFPRLKALGFTDRDGLRRFLKALDAAVRVTDYDLDVIASMMNCITPPLDGPTLDARQLKVIARAWMDDMYEFCNVWLYEVDLESRRVAFNLALREFRQARPWLMDNLRDGEFFDYQYPVDGTVLFYGLRRSPDDHEQVVFLANMEGAPRTLIPSYLPIPDLPADGWTLALAAPDTKAKDINKPVTLHDSQGLVFIRKGEP